MLSCSCLLGLVDSSVASCWSHWGTSVRFSYISACCLFLKSLIRVHELYQLVTLIDCYHSSRVFFDHPRPG